MTPFFNRRLRIEWGQCDPAGIVFAPRYLDMFSESTILLFEAAGFPKKRQMLEELGLAGFPLVDLSARFRRAASYGDDVVIETAAPVSNPSLWIMVGVTLALLTAALFTPIGEALFQFGRPDLAGLATALLGGAVTLVGALLMDRALRASPIDRQRNAH